MKINASFAAALLLVIWAVCVTASEDMSKHDAEALILSIDQAAAPTVASHAEVLSLMSLNHDRQCVAISLVAETILQAEIETDAAPQLPDIIAMRMFDNLATGERLALPRKLKFSGDMRAIDDPEAIKTLVAAADAYYARFCEGIYADPVRLAQHAEAAQDYVNDRKALVALLAADPDGAAMFCGYGMRTFADGEIGSTDHAFLIRLLPSGQLAVYDPNDITRPHRPTITTTGDGLRIEWSSVYKNTGRWATQRYKITPALAYFAAFNSPAAAI